MSKMTSTRQVIAVAGAGDLGRYICEEALKSPHCDVVVLTRSTQNKWFTNLQMPVYTTDYTITSILSILNTAKAAILVSTLNIPDPTYIATHTALLTACTQSQTCKRLIPSEWIGDSESHPLKPDYYATTREPFRQILKAQNEVEWTLLNPGWLMDYFLPSCKTHISPIPGKFPVDVERWQACVRGTGDETQSWTAARDVGRVVVELSRADSWEPVTYVAGEWSTFNGAIQILEAHHGREMPRTSKTWGQIQHSLEVHKHDTDMTESSELAQVEEMMVKGYLACPKGKTLRQRDTYFRNMEFMDLNALLRRADEVDRGVV